MKRPIQNAVSTCRRGARRGIGAVKSLIAGGNGRGPKCPPDLAQVVAAADTRLDRLVVLCGALAGGDGATITTARALPGKPGDPEPELADTETLLAFESHLRRIVSQHAAHGVSKRVKDSLQCCQWLIQAVLDGGRVVPCWDAAARTLSVGRQPVKCFRVPAGNQVAVLAAFQRKGWPFRIANPLAAKNKRDAKLRLNQTVRSLNRHRLARIIRFSGDGTGLGITWRLVHDWR
jgi:hypothetical protein